MGGDSSLLIWVLSATVGLMAVVALFRARQKSAHANLALVIPPVAPADPRDRRAGPRRDGNVIEALLSDAAAQASPETIWVLDRGCGGLRLAVNRECPLATILSIRTCAAPPETPWVAVAVRHTRPVNGRWELGCQFVEPPPWNVLLLFG